MAVHTLGTNTNASLTIALKQGSGNADADVATLQQAINDDFLLSNPVSGAVPNVTRAWAGAYTKAGLLYVPNRGYLKVFPNDVVAVDPQTGFPILIPNIVLTIAGSVWTFT